MQGLDPRIVTGLKDSANHAIRRGRNRWFNLRWGPYWHTGVRGGLGEREEQGTNQGFAKAKIDV